jgi:cyclic pyranopterin phosphate synthase
LLSEKPLGKGIDMHSNNLKMIDISEKKTTKRLAVARGYIKIKKDVLRLIEKEKIEKGNVLVASKLAGILASKKTYFLLPLCHPISFENIEIDIEIDKKNSQIKVESKVKGEAKTGYEMEALTSVVVALLNIYDMCKSLDREMKITEISLLEKKGGKSER